MNKFWVMDSLEPLKVDIGDRIYRVVTGTEAGLKYFGNLEEAKAFAEGNFNQHEMMAIDEIMVDWDFIDTNCYTECPLCGKITFRMNDIYCSQCDHDEEGDFVDEYDLTYGEDEEL